MKPNQPMWRRILLGCALMLSTASVVVAQDMHPTSIHVGVLKGLSPELRSLPTSFPESNNKRNREFGENDKANKRIRMTQENPNAVSSDGALFTPKRTRMPSAPFAPQLTFDGNGKVDNAALGFGNLVPPDPVMSVGPNHVVQMINLSHSIYNKNGVKLNGPVKFSSIAPGASDDGDPIALYDQLADRWLLLQFSDITSGSDRLIFCISQTPDPAGAYYVYSYTLSGIMPDYPHIAVWGDSYLITTHEFNSPAANTYLGQGFYAVDRKKMIAGSPTSTMIRFVDANQGGFLPSSLEGLKTAPAGALPTFCSYEADEWGGGIPNDRLLIRTLIPDFTTPANSTLSATTFLTTSTFDGRSPNTRNAIEQSGTANGLDAIADRMMSRIIYRRFDTYESMVMNHVVNISGVNPTNAGTFQAAMRWYELRRPNPGSAWTIHQQATYAPYPVSGATGMNCWMGSIGIDQKGSIALAYSTSKSDTFPSLKYALRHEFDAPGALSVDQYFHPGGGSQTTTANRWGDYSAMATDPSNEDTLWFTGEYYAATSLRDFSTRIGKFTIDLPPTQPQVHFKVGGTIARQIESITPLPGSTCLLFKDYPILLQIDQAPSQPVNVTLNVTGTAEAGVDYELLNSTPITLSAGNLSHTMTLRVYDNAMGEADETVELSYTLNTNGGNGTTASYNQKHLITIIGTPGVDINSLLTPTYGSPVNVFSENFDGIVSGLGNWTNTVVSGTSPNSFAVTTNGGVGFAGKSLHISNGASAYQYGASTSTTTQIRAESPLIDITGKGEVEVSFKYKCVGETPTFDFGSLYYSADGGTTWINAAPLQLLISTATATNITIPLPSIVQDINNLRIGFVWTNDNSVQNQPPLGVDSVSVTAKPIINTSAIQNTVNSLTIGERNFGPFQTNHFIDPLTNKIMMTLTNNSAHNFGCTKVEVDRAGISAVDFNTATASERVTSKTFKVTPEFNNVNASYTIKLYYEEAEIAGWEAATTQNRNNAKIVKVNGSNGIQAVTPANQGSFVYSINNATLGAFGVNGVTFETTIPTGGFSGFGVGIPQPQNALPMTLISFFGEHQSGKGNELTWVVTNQVNVAHYELEFSPNGTDFMLAGKVNAKEWNNMELSYQFLHRNYIVGKNYYRLKAVDFDGKSQYSHVVVLNVNEDGRSLSLYPNPATDHLYVNYKGSTGTITLDVLDLLGKVISTSSFSSNSIMKVSTEGLARGEYMLRLTDKSGCMTTRFMKK